LRRERVSAILTSMRDQSPTYYCGIDIGTQTVRCIIGIQDQNDASRLSVVGHGTAQNIGMRKGIVSHTEDVTEAIIKAVTEAERVSGANISTATVNVNGSHIQGFDSRGVIAISTANKEISPEDRLRVEEAAATIQMPPNREIVQQFSRNYSVDGQDNIKDPVGMQGVRLEVDMHIVTATTPNVRALFDALQGARIYPNRYTISPLAAAEITLNRQQREAGTVIVDIGAGTTSLAIIEDGEVQHVAVIPMGGMHITNDLAIGLKTDLDIAEAVKIEHGSLSVDDIPAEVTLSHKETEYSFDGGDVAMIIESRVDEILEYVEKELKRAGKSQKLPGGVVLVGGTANLSELSTYAKEKLQLAARVGTIDQVSGLIDTIENPAYATAIGLMMLDMYLGPDSNIAIGEPNPSFFGFLDGLWPLKKS
jgi:cell division protein FtsA